MLMKTIIAVYNKLFDWGVFKPIRLNITESDDTSSVGRKRITRTAWSAMVEKRHQKGFGKTFSIPIASPIKKIPVKRCN